MYQRGHYTSRSLYKTRTERAYLYISVARSSAVALYNDTRYSVEWEQSCHSFYVKSILAFLIIFDNLNFDYGSGNFSQSELRNSEPTKMQSISQYFSELLQYFSAIVEKYCNIALVFCAIIKMYCNIAQYCALFLQYLSIIKKTHFEA